MDTEQRIEDQALVAIYTPYLQGFYFGELVGQLLQLCRIKNYRVAVIKTDGFGSYKSSFHIDQIDMAIILRNAIHVDLAKDLLAKGKPLVSISYDYFPLNIPVISCDNEHGIELAFSYLLEKEHKQFAFIGNLKNFDVRKRYEAFCDLAEQHKLSLHDDHIVTVNDDSLTGGYQAAKLFIEQNCKATAIVCGSSLNAIGFSQQLDELDPDRRHCLDIVGFDAISLIPVLESKIATIDQNFNLIAHRALSVVEEVIDGFDEKRHHKVKPKLISEHTDFMQSADAYLATSFELAELYNANYMKCVIANMHEWTREIATSNLNSIMSLRPLFGRYLSIATFSRFASGKNGARFIKVMKLISEDSIEVSEPKDIKSLCPANEFPPKYGLLDSQKYNVSIHLPLSRGDATWGVISVFGDQGKAHLLSSYSALCTYLDWIADLTLLKNIQLAEGNATEITSTQKDQAGGNFQAGKIAWNTSTNETEWDDRALEILGFTNDMERNIYKHMDISDRVQETDEAKLMNCLNHTNPVPFCVNVSLKHKNRSYILCEICCNTDDIGDISTLEISHQNIGD